MDEELYEDDFDDDEVIENAVLCPTCEDVTGHQILKEKEIGRGKDYLLRCEACSTVHEIQFRARRLGSGFLELGRRACIGLALDQKLDSMTAHGRPPKPKACRATGYISA